MSLLVTLYDPTGTPYVVTPKVYSCADANVRGGADDDITFSAPHGLSLNQPLLYKSSAGHDIGGLHNGMLYYVKTMPTTSSITLAETPGGTLVDLTVPAGGDTHYFSTQGSGHDLRGDSLPDLSLSLSNGDSEVESGDLEMVFQNYDAWYDTRWMQPDPEQFFDEATGIGCWNLVLQKNGVTRWVGDLDPHSVRFDTEAKSVSATFLGKMKRLERYNAEFVRRPIPQYADGAASFTDLGGGVYRATLTNTYAVNAFLNHRFVDSAGDVMTITASTASSVHSVDLTLAGGSPAAGAFNIRPFVWTTDRSVSQRIMTVRVNKDASNGPTIAALGLEAGDTVSYSKLRYSGNLKQQALEIQQVGPHTSTGTGDPTLTAYQVQLKTRLQVELNENCASSCATPYWRNIAPRDLAIKIFDHCGIGAGDREINIPLSASGDSTAVASGYLEDTSGDTPITADDQFNNQWLIDSAGNRFKITDTILSTHRLYVYGVPAAGAYEIHYMVCEYADMEGKSCGAALKELADNASALIFTTPAKYHVIAYGQSKAGVAGKDIDALALAGESVQALSDDSVSLVKVSGPEDGVYAQKGALLYPEATLDIQTDFLTSRGTMEQIAAVKWAQECRRKRTAVFPVLDDGTAYQILDEVVRTVAGVATTFQVTAVREPFLAADDATRTTIELEAIELTGLAYTTGNGDVGAEAIDKSPPPAPVILAVTRSYSATFEALYPKKAYPRWYPGSEVVDKDPLTINVFKRDLHEVKIAWPYDDLGGNLLGFILRKRWDGSDPDKPIGYCSWMDPQDQADGYFYWPPDSGDGNGGIMYVRRGRMVWFSAQAVYEDGRVSPISDEVSTLEGDEAVDGVRAPTLGTVTSYVKDLSGTARVECDLTVPATHTPCDEVEFSVTDPDGVHTKKLSIPKSAGNVELSCLDANVRGGASDDVTFLVAHGWLANQALVYNSSAGNDIGGLTSGTTYYVKTVPTGASLTLSATAGGAKIDLTVPTGGDRHYFTPLITTTAYWKSMFSRAASLTDIKARCIASGQPGAWSAATTKTAGADSTAVSTPTAPVIKIRNRTPNKIKVRVLVANADSAATGKNVAAIEAYTAKKFASQSPEPDTYESAYGTSSGVGAGYLDDNSDSPITADDQFNGCELVDSAGARFPITDTTLSTHRYALGTGVAQDGTSKTTPSAGAYVIDPVWQREEDKVVAKTARAGKRSWKMILHREEEAPDNSDWKAALAFRFRTADDAYSNFTFANTALAIEPYVSSASGLTITVKIEVTGGSGTYVKYRWNWGDGATDTDTASSSKSHTYAVADTYTVELQVWDSENTTGTASVEVSVGGIYTSGGAKLAGTGASAARLPDWDPPGFDTQVAWTNPTNAQGAADGSFATCDITSGDFSQSLKATNFANAVGSTKIITGVRVRFYWKCALLAATYMYPAWVQLTYNGNPIGVPYFFENRKLPTSVAWSDYFGSPIEKWGAVLTPTIVNHSTFGVLLGIYSAAGATRMAYVDAVEMTVYYDSGI